MGWLADIFKPKKVAGVEIIPDGAGGHLFHFAVLERKKGSLEVGDSSMGIPSMDGLLQELPKGMPIALSLNIRGIIHKEIQADGETDWMGMVMPGADGDGFLGQIIPMGDSHLASLIRKESALGWMGRFDERGCWVLGLGLGPFTTSGLMPFIRERLVTTDTHSLEFDGEHILSGYARRETGGEPPGQVVLGDERVDGHLLPALSVAFNALMDGNSVESDGISHWNREFIRKGQFNALGLSGLFLVLSILLASFFIGNQFKEENRGLALQLSGKEKELDKLERLRTQIAQYRRGGATRPSRASYYADRLASTRPADVGLEHLEVFPLEGEEKDYYGGAMLEYRDDYLLVRGIARNPAAYNRWLEKLADEPWVLEVLHLRYEDTDEGVGEFEFGITIAE